MFRDFDMFAEDAKEDDYQTCPEQTNRSKIADLVVDGVRVVGKNKDDVQYISELAASVSFTVPKSWSLE